MDMIRLIDGSEGTVVGVLHTGGTPEYIVEIAGTDEVRETVPLDQIKEVIFQLPLTDPETKH
ncbi:hypothetical protein EDC14_100184 [Hydrogenispora ethanolica]|uniref:DUF4926 domain-containing protein n=1 Tax=Hydrogenispora ethanolica TaxID=1082276 RepID=A0A4R1SDR9_HYDET|nr:hypothetical protein [Hydrogenispora ethanolica]TCL76802.1 hypothetical protein EDC14_100184 [Hydrogenispora ethanolica]